MRRFPYFLVAGLTASILFSSCSSGVAPSTRTVSVEDLVRRVRANASGVRLLAGKGSLWFESPQAAGSAFFTIAMCRPDSLLVRLKGPFGVEVGLLFLSKDRFLVYNGMDNRVITGTPSAASIKAVLPIDLTYDQIVDAFAGSFLPDPPPGVTVRFEIDNDAFRLVYPCGTDTCSYWIDPETDVVTEYLLTEPGGRVLLEAHTGKAFERGGVHFPRTVQIWLERQELSIQYSSLELNESQPSFVYSIPPNARRSQW